MHYKVGTRGSKLALTQTMNVINTLRAAYPADTFEPEIIRTAGDRNQTSLISQVGSKGVFVDEIEDALLDGSIQLAVHSMKDMPAQPKAGLTFCRPWKREDPRDVLILRQANTLDTLPQGAKIGTGSLRRSFQLQALRPDLQMIPIRGNIDTRLKKLMTPLPDGSMLDGIVLAAAGLNRLGLKPEYTQILSVDEMIPASTQGTLAIEVNEKNTDLLDMLNRLSDPETEASTFVERAFLQRIGGDCHLPIAAYCEKSGTGYRLLAMFGKESGESARVCVESAVPDTAMAEKAAAALLAELEDK